MSTNGTQRGKMSWVLIRSASERQHVMGTQQKVPQRGKMSWVLIRSASERQHVGIH